MRLRPDCAGAAGMPLRYRRFGAILGDTVRPYRLTLDYQEDLDMFNKVEAHFKTLKKELILITGISVDT